jgi:hypothetical protein
MRTIVAALAISLVAFPACAQGDPGALIGKLKSADKDEVENATTDLLKLGEAALAPLREAAAKSEDAAFKKLAASVADRIEIRKGAAGLAKSWGDRWYAIYIKALKVGWAHLKAEEKDGKILLDDELLIKQGGTDISIRAKVTCKTDEFLSLASTQLEIQGPENAGSYSAEVKEGRLIARSGGQVEAKRVGANITVDFAVLRLVTVMPKIDEFPLTVIGLIKPKIHETSIVKFDKEDSISHEERKVKCRRFILSFGDGEPDRFLWVDAEGRLLRMEVTGDDKLVEMVLQDEKRAKELDE